MRICIITVYNSVNCGSYWQAVSLKDYLENLGHEVFFYKRETKGTSSALLKNIQEILKTIAKFRFKSAILLFQRYISFIQAIEKLPVIDEKSPEFQNIDCFILGSDTIWNVQSSYFKSKIDVYFGSRFSDKKVFSYAASIGNTPYDLLLNNREIKNSLNQLNAISVRDEYTKNIILRITHKDPFVVCDPTLLFSSERYIAMYSEEKLKDKYILLYYFGRIPEDTKKAIIELKEITGMKIIAFCDYHTYSWCDMCIPYEPQLMMEFYKGADFVITNTFHGTIFALIYQKNFADYGRSKKKIFDLLESLNLTSRFLDTRDALVPYLTKEIDYANVSKKIDEIKTNGEQFLKMALEEK